jgi:hypothetical protein
MQRSVLLVLVFPDSSELRWVYEPPKLGSEMESSFGQSWRVEEVLQSGVGLYTVHCGPRHPGLTHAQHLATDLLARARRAVSLQERRRRRYIP